MFDFFARIKRIEEQNKKILSLLEARKNDWKNQTLFCAENGIGSRTLAGLVAANRVEKYQLSATNVKYRWADQ